MALEALNLSPEQIKEIPMVDIVFELMKEANESLNFSDICKTVQGLKGFSEDDLLDYMTQLYTELNIDGRFICVGRGLWGLREWYTLEQGTDAAVAASINEDDFEEDDDYYEDGDADMEDKDMEQEGELLIDEAGDLFDADADEVGELDDEF